MDGDGAATEPETSNSLTDLSTVATRDAKPRPAHQRLVLTDPVAFRYLEEDTSLTVLERRRRLQGYESYIVEQWICSREHPTFIITTYTGLEQHSVFVGVLSVPTDEDEWSPRLRVWFKALAKFHARKKETPLGTLMVTNLSGFPSALTVISVPDGDVKKHRDDFIVNENMKRLGCSGRAGLNLAPPTSATQAKFKQQYRTSDHVSFYGAVIELVKLSQVALVLYGKLAPEYADGLVCDVTERAINDWWSDLGAEYFNIDPTDGILGPTTVSAMLGLLLGARNRLHAYGAPVAKDVFDLISTKRAIAYFQKSQKIKQTRRLDRKTLECLHKATAKAASGEGWTMPRAVKTTVAELSGKGSNMVMGRTGAREKAGIADIETLDIETFISLLSGERSKWLWYGKPRKNNESDSLSNLGGDDGIVFTKDENGGYKWTSQKRDSAVDDNRVRGLSSQIYNHSTHGSQASIESPEKEQALRRKALKTVSGRVTDARSGLGRIKDAVGMAGLRGHHHKYSKEDNVLSDAESFRDRPSRRNDEQATANIEDTSSLKSQEDLPMANGKALPISASLPELVNPQQQQLEAHSSSQDYSKDGDKLDTSSNASSVSAAQGIGPAKRPSLPLATADNQLALDFDGELAKRASGLDRVSLDKTFRRQPALPMPLRRTRSLPHCTTPVGLDHTEAYRWARHLSFSNFVDVLANDNAGSWPVAPSSEIDETKAPNNALLREKGLAFEAHQMAKSLQQLRENDGSLVERKVDEVTALDKQAAHDHEVLEDLYHTKLEEHNSLKEASDDLLAEERTTLAECVKDVEILGAKLEYELNTLQSKVEDMENGIADFERQIEQLESRAEELIEEKRISWVQWALGFFSRTSKPQQ
ncbi:MAG: hypothetical protein Q9191_001630 [Dirinaria sp. TL-2023a]